MRKLILALFTAAALIAAPSAQGTAAKKTAAKTEAKSEKKAGGLIDVNSASAAELKTLPGIGDAYAEKIIQNRPYSGKDDIVRKAGVPRATYEKIKGQIIAKQNKSAAKKK